MRLWTLHPKYLDAQGLTALWREARLARRRPDLWRRLRLLAEPEHHPLFILRDGPIEPWERIE